MNIRERKPPWLKVVAPSGEKYVQVKHAVESLQLHTVCKEARCPNVGECWAAGTATVILLGDTCTRSCRFCAVGSGRPNGVDHEEPARVAQAVGRLGLRYVVLTMVNRDDLPDGGAEHVARTIKLIHEAGQQILVEPLVGDFKGDTRAIDMVLEAKPEVFAHNLEVVRRISQGVRDARCDYDLSLRVLSYARGQLPVGAFTKSSLMVGAGETDEEVLAALKDLRDASVDIVTIGQYLRPTPRHLPVDRYVTPEQFEEYRRAAESMGFVFVASGPLVRSSYRAAEGFVSASREKRAVGNQEN